MSVLNQSGEEQVECPLCMEPLEVDDLNFFPCTCGYQICRFCWHRIRLDENGGLCPACRKAYSENPADFIPLSQEQVAKLKAEKRQRDQQRKAKLTESRKHLASVRVVQRNLVFVVGLPPRLADAEVLKRHDYFGKFGKIHKVVINQSTSYAGSQGPSASAYVTYLKSDDALRAIQAVNNVTIDSRVIKSSLGTTKYCSHFMKNQACPKPDCMYLHEYGDPEASFTKEQMHAGKHQEYEKRLHDDLILRVKAQSLQQQNGSQNGVENPAALGHAKGEGKNGAKSAKDTGNGVSNQNSKEGGGTNNRESWPQLDKENKKDSKDKSRKGKTKNSSNNTNSVTNHGDLAGRQSNSKEKKDFCSSNNVKNMADSRTHTGTNSRSSSQPITKIEARDPDQMQPPTISPPALSSSPSSTSSSLSVDPTPSPSPPQRQDSPPLSTSTAGTTTAPISVQSKLPAGLVTSVAPDDNTSFFSSGGAFGKLSSAVEKNTNGAAQLLLNGIEAAGDREHSLLDDLQHRRIDEEVLRSEEEHSIGHQQVFTDTLPNINTTEDWVAAFGLANHSNGTTLRDHDLLQQKIQQQQREQQQQAMASKLGAFGGFGPLAGQGNAFGNKGLDSYGGFYEMSKLQENLMDALANKTNGLNLRQHETQMTQAPIPPPQSTHINGLDQNMSKFFSDFSKLHGNKEQPSLTPFQNGFNGLNSYHHSLLLQQKQIEEQLMNLGTLKNYGTQNGVYQNGLGPQTPSFGSNGDSTVINGGLNGLHSLYSKQQQPLLSPIQQTQHILSSEAELDFDPFQETQKALAELIEREQGHKTHNSHTDRNNSSQINGLIHNTNQNGGSHMPPPPPGFLHQQQPQATTHMNSFGSKILPFLNMSNSQPQLNSSTNNWPSSFNTTQMSQQPQKNISNTCNDWKVLDPAILSASTCNYQVPPQPAPQMPPLRDHFANGQMAPPPHMQQQTQQNGVAPPRLFDYPGANTFSNFNTEVCGVSIQEREILRVLSRPSHQTDLYNSSFPLSKVMTSVNFTQLQQQQPQQPSYNAFATHLNSQQPNLTWFNQDLNSQISSPPGFRTPQATKQQEC